MTKKTVLVLHSSADLYGAGRVLLWSVAALRSNGFTPVIVLPYDGPLAAEVRKLQVTVHITNLGVVRRQYLNPLGIVNRMYRLWLASRTLRRLVSDHGADVIYSNTAAVWIGAWTARKLGLTHIWHIHEIVVEPHWFRRALAWFIDRTGDLIICVSEAVVANLSPHVQTDKLALVRNGIDPTLFDEAAHDLTSELGLPDGTLLVGMVARVHFRKGQTYFLDIAKRIVAKRPSVHFVMVGDAFPGHEHLYDEIAQKVEREGLERHVTDLGYRTDIPRLMSGLDVFVLPSTEPDSLPTSVLEAMAASLPVVSTSVGGTPEIVVHEVTGFLVPSDDAVRAAAPLEKLLSDPALRRRMGAAGRERITSNFSMQAFERSLVAVVRGALE